MLFKTFSNGCLGYIRIRKQEITHHAVQIVTSADELPKGAQRWTKRIEFRNRKTILGVRAAKVRKLGQKRFNHRARNWLVNPGPDLDVAGIKTNLPRVRWRNDHVTPYQFTPMHVVAKCCR